MAISIQGALRSSVALFAGATLFACDPPSTPPHVPAAGASTAPKPFLTVEAEPGKVDAGATPTWSCDMRAERGTCLEGFERSEAWRVTECEARPVNGKYATGVCPVERALGVCTLYDGSRRHYYAGEARDGFGGTVEAARGACEGHNDEFAKRGMKQTFVPR